MISKYEELSEKQKQLDKPINHISLLINMNAILVQKVDNGWVGGGGEEKEPSFWGQTTSNYFM